jgi:hypothetical protein
VPPIGLYNSRLCGQPSRAEGLSPLNMGDLGPHGPIGLTAAEWEPTAVVTDSFGSLVTGAVPAEIRGRLASAPAADAEKIASSVRLLLLAEVDDDPTVLFL